MFTMFNQFFLMFTNLFSAGGYAASALNHLAIALDETAGAYEDEQRIERQKKLNGLNRELAATAPKQTTATK